MRKKDSEWGSVLPKDTQQADDGGFAFSLAAEVEESGQEK